MPNLLIVDDEKDFCKVLSGFLSKEGYEIKVAYNGESALEQIKEGSIDTVLLDLKIPGISGMKILKKIKENDENLPIIILTGYADVKTAVKAMKTGAFDYLSKPVDEDELLVVIDRAIKQRNMSDGVKALWQYIDKEKSVEFVEGKSTASRDLMEKIKNVAPTGMTVLLHGESGTGKEVIARLVHSLSKRREKPFVTIDCGTLPESLIESELFGYERGAFTGANQRKLGYCELADGGSLFLDEIANLDLSMQAKLLRLIQEKTFFHIGGKSEIKVDVRIIAATNINLENAVRERKFREDLYHRLNEFTIRAPLLKERKEDIVLLTRKFLNEANKELGKKISGISIEAAKVMQKYNWPGNIRELKNTIKRAVLLAEKMILPEHLQISLTKKDEIEIEELGLNNIKLKNATSSVEKEMIKKALEKTKYKKIKAAKILGIDRVTLYYKIKKYKL